MHPQRQQAKGNCKIALQLNYKGSPPWLTHSRQQMCADTSMGEPGAHRQ